MTMEFLHKREHTSDFLKNAPSDLCLTALSANELLVEAERDKVPIIIDQAVIDDYIKAFKNLKPNEETLDAFKKACKSLPRLDQAGLEKAIAAAARNKNVDCELVVRHIYEILKKSKFTDVNPMSRGKDSGGFVVKNKQEIYVGFHFNKVPEGEGKIPPGAVVTVNFQNGIPKME